MLNPDDRTFLHRSRNVPSSTFDTRYNQYQLASDEVANQIERLTGSHSDEFEATVGQLELSDEIKAALSQASISAKTIDDLDGRRVVVSLQWDTAGQRKSVSLTGWLPPSVFSNRQLNQARSHRYE